MRHAERGGALVARDGVLTVSGRALAGARTGLADAHVPGPAPVGALLRALFGALDGAQICYCVMRGYAGLPDQVAHDLDLLVAGRDRARFEQALDGACRQTGWRIAARIERAWFCRWYVAREEENGLRFVQIEVLTDLRWKGVRYADAGAILAARRRRRFWVAAGGSEAAVTLFKEYVPWGRVKDKGPGEAKARIRQLAGADPAQFTAALAPCLGEQTARWALACAQDARWAEMERQVGRVRRRLVARALLRRPFAQLVAWARFLWGHVGDKAIHPSGLFVCLIGPDGAGKTTLARGIARDLGGVFSAVRYHHGHWAWLPELKVLWRALGGAPGRAGDARAGRERAGAPLGSARALLHVLYYGLEYVLGHLSLARARGWGELVVFDRYAYDYAVQSTYRRVPRALLRALEWVAPQPDVLICLAGEEEAIQARKEELTVDEVARQLAACAAIARRRGGVVVDTTDQSIQSAVGCARRAVISCMMARAARRKRGGA